MWPSFLCSFLAGLATSICSGESKGNTEECTDLVWSKEKKRRGPAHILCSLFFFIPSVSLPVKGGSSSPGLSLGPFRCPWWFSPAFQESMTIATYTKQLKG